MSITMISNQESSKDRLDIQMNMEANFSIFLAGHGSKLSFSFAQTIFIENGRRDEGAIHEALREAFANRYYSWWIRG